VPPVVGPVLLRVDEAISGLLQPLHVLLKINEVFHPLNLDGTPPLLKPVLLHAQFSVKSLTDDLLAHYVTLIVTVKDNKSNYKSEKNYCF